jgi:AsmA protein
MNRVMRVFVIVLAVVVLLIAAAALILPRVIDPNNYRDEIAALVKAKTGRDLTIAGDIGWSVFPWLAVELGETRLSNAEGFGPEPFAQVAAVEVRVKLLPLLRKEVEMSTVVLDGLQVNLAKDRNGRSNWADLMPEDTAPAQPREPTTSEGGMPLAALAIGGVRVRDARLVWDDRQSGSRQQIDQLNLELGAIRGGEPVDLSLAFVVKGGEPELTSDLKLTGEVSLSEALDQIEVRDLKLRLVAQGDQVPGGALNADLSAQLAMDMNKQTLSLKELLVEALDLRLHGQAQGTGVGTESQQFAGTLRLEEFTPRDLLNRLTIAPPEVSDSTVLGKAAGEFAFKATDRSVNLTDLRLRLDDTAVTGGVGVADFSTPAISFNLLVDSLDLDRYLPPRKPGEVQAAPTPAEAAAGGAAALPVDTLRGLNLNGTLKIAQLKAYQLRSSDISVTVTAKQGLVRVHPASAKMYQGSYNGDVTLDVRGKTPRVALNEKVAGVQAGPMLTDMLGSTKVTGTANVAVKLEAAGEDAAAMRSTANGTANFAFTDGTIKGMDVLGEIRKAYGVLRGKPQPAATGETEFSSVTGSATITNGLVNNPDLLGKSPLMQVQGSGTANLVSEALDYRINATLVDTLEGRGELTGRPIPVRISGTFDAPKVGVDLKQVLEQEVRQKVEEKVQEKVQEQLQDKVQDKLKGLFGR